LAEDLVQKSMKLPRADDELISKLMADFNITSIGATVHLLCDEHRGIAQKPIAETLTEDKLSPCIRRIRVMGKEGLEYLCVFKRPCSPPQQTKLRSLDVCESCKEQMLEHEQFKKVAENEETPIKSQHLQPTEEPEPIADPLTIRHNVKNAFIMKSDGSHACPIDGKQVWRTNCYMCKKHNVAKNEACVKLFYENANVQKLR
jgi:hypothetical protein